MRIAAVIPTYNEAENLPKLVSALFSLPLDLSLLVVDDNSPDGTGDVAEALSRGQPRLGVLHRVGQRGLRTAYLRGMERVLSEGTDAVLQIDADLSHDPQKVIDFSDALAEADMVLGSRYIPGGSLDSDWPRWRRGLSAFGNFYARTILGIPLTDITTGFRLWRADALRAMPLNRIQSNGYIFLVEMAYMAHRLRYRIKEVPIHFSERRYGASKMSLRIQVEAAFRVWQVRWHHRDLRPAGRGARISTSR